LTGSTLAAESAPRPDLPDGRPDDRDPPLIERGPRAALITFAVACVASGVLVLTWLGNQRWFVSDEWDFLATRQLTDLADLMKPHNEHWTALPAVAYRLVWEVVGLHAYWPYQALVVVAHVLVVVLLRIVMRRAGVSPWIATITAASLLLFGAGDQNIVWAFQISFVGALGFGLVQLILADHDGGIERRDWLGLVAGAAALMCSGVGISMVVVVGLAALIRRGWRAALFHTLPLAALYATWYVVESPPGSANPDGSSAAHIAGEMAAFVAHGFTHAVAGLGSYPGVGVLLTALTVIGLAVAWRPIGWRGFRRAGAAVAALLVGSVAFMTLSAYGRWSAGADYADQKRYVYVIGALLLPALAVAADALCRRWRQLTPVVLVLLLVGIPGNIVEFVNEDTYVGPAFDLSEQTALAVLSSPLADQVPDWVEFDPRVNPGLTVGFLRRARDEGALPEGRPLDEEAANQLPIRLGVVQSFGRPPAKDCQVLTGKLDLRPAKGTVYGFSGSMLAVTPLDDAGEPTAPPLKFATNHGLQLHILLDDLHVQIKPGVLGGELRWCE
jgi:hypothetical protein